MLTNILVKLFVKDSLNTESKKVRSSYGTLGSVTGIICNLLLFGLKFTIGTVSGAVSIIADGFNNLSDMGSSVVTLLGFKLANRPPDPEHPFGHGRIEYMSAFIVSMLIVVVGAELFTTSFNKMLNPTSLEISAVTFIGIIISVIVKFWMYLFNKSLGKKISSDALIATAKDSRNDCIATLAVGVSIVICKFSGINIDPYVGIAVALFIVWSGISTAKETLSPLLGEPPSEELVKNIESIILENKDFVGIHDLIIHNYGPGRLFASVHVEVPDTINISYCHEQIDACEATLKERLGIEVVIHMDPISTNCEATQKLKEAVLNKVKEIDDCLTIHDFRIVEGENRTNVIFDVVLPQKFFLTATEIKKVIDVKVKEIDKKYFTVVNVDYSYTL